jgi:cytochrome c5
MALRRGACSGRHATFVLVAVALAAFFAWTGVASAATIETGGTVFQEKCNPCHANIADSRPGSEIKFSHAYHIPFACASCHTQFPHQPQGTVKVAMKGCFACHGLRHGPNGTLARGNCDACHLTPRERMRPTANSLSAPAHTTDWALKPHVEPGRKNLRTQCMMCHDQKFCDDCHIQKSIMWKPAETYTYDPKTDCQVCHGQSNLTKASATGFTSFQVLGVNDSVHGSLSCTSCHIDFKYYDAADPTKLWDVNAGLGCRACHEGKVPGYEKQVAPFQKVVAQWENSVHAQKLFGGNLQSATCASCHKGHDIQRLDTAAAKAAFHASGYDVCARCHLDKYRSYDDYYHGAAYKKGAADAPACWECHASHDIWPSANKASMTSDENLPKTCGGAAAGRTCHAGSKESFAAGAKNLIHQKTQVQATNPLEQVIAKIKSWFS